MNIKRGNHETRLKQCESMDQNFIEIQKNHRALKHHICYNHIDRLKYDEEEVAVVPPRYYSYNWMPKFLHQLPEIVTIESHNKYYNKMSHLKSKTKPWQGASFNMCNEHSSIAFWEQGFTNMHFDTHDASQIELGNYEVKRE